MRKKENKRHWGAMRADLFWGYKPLLVLNITNYLNTINENVEFMAIHHNDPGMFIEKLVWQANNFPYFSGSDLRMCTNFEFDFDSMNWTDNNLLVTDNIVAKWEEKIGQFWNTPIEPFIPIQNLNHSNDCSISA